MEKLKASKKDVKEASYRILSVGYCEAQYLLRGVSPVCYCSGYYGWCCDNYDMTPFDYNLTISTGYGPIGDQNISKEVLKNKYNIIKKYEEKAKKIQRETAGGWEKIKKLLDKNLAEFVKEVCKNEEL